MSGAIIGGVVAVFVLFFLILWVAQREAKFSAQVAGLIALNLITGLVFSWGLGEAVPMLRRLSEYWFWAFCIVWLVAVLFALWAPWYFFGNKQR